MVGENFRSWLAAWEKNGWLTRIRKTVNPQYVLGAITKKLEKERGVIFEQVSGYSIPLATNFFFSRKALAAALDMAEGELIPNFRKAMEKPRPCEVLGQAPFQENVLTQNLNPWQIFPVPTYHERDAGPYITAGVLIAKDPETGIRNASIHRLRVFQDDVLGLLILPRHLNLCLQKCIQMKRPLEVAVVVGVDPFTLLASQAILPFGVDELEVANALRPSVPLKLARCASLDLEVPADSEIVFEGIIDPTRTRVEGPFGEFPQYYSPEAPRPIFKLKAICFRKNPFFYSTLPASREHLLLGAIPREASILTDVQRAVPSVRAVHLAYGGTCRYHLVISLVKRSEGEARMAMLAAMANNADIKHVVVVDEDIDIFDMEQVEWALATRFQADRDTVILSGKPSSSLDPSAQHVPGAKSIGAKLGLDATIKGGDAANFTRVPYPQLGADRARELLGE
jgi:2,5-furandicarboxylate decarboxylase 1